MQTIVVNGDKGWQSAGGPAMALGAERLREIRNEMYVLWLTTLTPLKKDDVQLSPLPDIKVHGEAAAGIKATSKGHPDVKLYFDKKTHLLVKVDAASPRPACPLTRKISTAITRLSMACNCRRN